MQHLESSVPKINSIFVLRIRPEPSCTDPARALRWLLKSMLRSYGLRVVSIDEIETSVSP